MVTDDKNKNDESGAQSEAKKKQETTYVKNAHAAGDGAIEKTDEQIPAKENKSEDKTY